MHTLTDWRGTPIDKGCTLVYPGRSSGDLWMTEATVEDIIEVDIGHGILKPALRVRRTKAMRGTINNTRILTAVDRVTVVSLPVPEVDVDAEFAAYEGVPSK